MATPQLTSISPSIPVNHYKAYKPRPFEREEREKVTILYGGLTWKHERLIQGALHNLKYNAEPLPNITREDLDAGKELIDVGACCPTIFTTGSLVNLLKKKVAAQGKDEVKEKYVYLTAGACGPCRFGQYHESYAMALDGLGLRDLRIFLFAQDELDQSGGRRRAAGQPAVQSRLNLGNFVRGPVDGPGIHDAAVRGQGGRDGPGAERECRVSVWHFPESAGPRRKVRNTGLALDEQLFHQRAPRGSQEVGRHRSGSPTCEGEGENYRGILAAD